MTEATLSAKFFVDDEALIGLSRGAITELTGDRSSGKTSFLCSVLAQATARSECCAVIDTHDAFDPASAACHGVDLARVVWVRCGGRVETAMKAADLILHGGGFGVVCLDLSEVPAGVLQRIPIPWWWRFRSDFMPASVCHAANPRGIPELDDRCQQPNVCFHVWTESASPAVVDLNRQTTKLRGCQWNARASCAPSAGEPPQVETAPACRPKTATARVGKHPPVRA